MEIEQSFLFLGLLISFGMSTQDYLFMFAYLFPSVYYLFIITPVNVYAILAHFLFLKLSILFGISIQVSY